MSLFVYDKYIRLLTSTFYLMEAIPTELQICIDQLWEYQSITAILTAFVCLHSELFVNTLHFI